MQKTYYTAISKAKGLYYAGRIELANNNSREIFSIVQSFMRPKGEETKLPASNTWCEKLSEFFTNKIRAIQAGLRGQSPPLMGVGPLAVPPVPSSIFEAFTPIDLSE